MKNKKGISLVALIITIIVMVILAGIIITAAVADGGIIDRAKISMIEQEMAEIQEIIEASYVIKDLASTSIFSYLDLDKTGIAIYENLTANGFDVIGATNAKDESGNNIKDENGKDVMTAPLDDNKTSIDVTVEGKHGTYEGTIKEQGMVGDLTIKGEESDNNETPEDTTQPPLEDDEDLNIWVENGNGTYTKNNETVEIGKTTYTNVEVLEKLGITESTGTYTGTWTVIGVEGDKLKLVSTEDVKDYMFLGKTDKNAYEKDAEGNVTTTIKSEIQDYNSDNKIGEYDIAVWSYANAVKTLNEETKLVTGIESARSIKIEDIYDIIGEENVIKHENDGTMYYYYFNDTRVHSKNKSTSSSEYRNRRL